MPRPKKARVVDGVELADNLYPDNKGRPGHYRYKRQDGSWKHLKADTPQLANEIAEENNQAAESYVPGEPGIHKDSLVFLVPLFIAWREKLHPQLKKKDSWKNRRGHLKAFAKAFQSVPVHKMTRHNIQDWWEGLTFHQQKQRHAEFRRLFSWLIGEGLCKHLEYNPFTLSDEQAKLALSGQSEKARLPLTRDQFWKIYQAAGELDLECLQIAMGICLTTFMREKDILTLRLDQDLEGNLLKKVISKSEAQKGTARAARLQWDVGSHGLLKNLLKRARELSLKNHRCPYVVSHTPLVKKTGKTKDHFAQVTPRRLITFFDQARKHAGVHQQIPADRSPATFHEVRGLADKLAVDAGYDIKVIQGVMAHEDESTTKDYLDGHQLPFDTVDIVFTEEMIGGTF